MLQLLSLKCGVYVSAKFESLTIYIYSHIPLFLQADFCMNPRNKTMRKCQIELNTIKNAINGNHSDLADFKRQGAAGCLGE